MDAGIKLGNEISKASSDNVAKTVEKIFRVGYQTHMDQATIVKALDAMAQSFNIESVTITGCTFGDDKVVNT